MKYKYLCQFFIIGLIFSGCGHTYDLTGDTLPENDSKLDYSVTYYIHADSDYLYHTSDGDPVRGNAKVLTTAFEVGEAAHSGEVFIYHQRPEKKFLGIFPRRSSRFFHYKNGRLIHHVKYRHADRKEAFLAAETQLMNQYRTQNQANDHQNYFLYFGHEIPTGNGEGYHQSLPDIHVNTAALAKGIHNLLPSDKERYSLIVLSTCNNGTPEMAERLLPMTDLMLASPQNLHLSHVDSDAITTLESDPDTPPIQIARLMAERTYQRLVEEVQTTITLALYDFEEVWAYIKPLTSLTEATNVPEPSVQFQDNVDCAELSGQDFSRFRNGVETWFKPARFGRQSGQRTHSGWGCKPLHSNER